MRRPALALVRTRAFPRGLEAFAGGACGRGRGAAAPRGEGPRRRSHDSAIDRRARSGCTQRGAGRGPVARPERCVAPVVRAGVPGVSTPDRAAAERLFIEATGLARAHAPGSVLLAFALFWHGVLALNHRDLDGAERLFSEKHAIGCQAGHPPAIPLPPLVVRHL